MPHPAGHHAHPNDTPVGPVITRRQALQLFTAPLRLGLAVSETDAGCAATFNIALYVD